MTDRKLCKNCVYSGYNGTQTKVWQGCNYIIYTGMKRPHNGDECNGYKPKDGRRKRRWTDIVISEKSTAIYIEKAAAAKQQGAGGKKKKRLRYPDPDREIRAAARRIMAAVS